MYVFFLIKYIFSAIILLFVYISFTKGIVGYLDRTYVIKILAKIAIKDQIK